MHIRSHLPSSGLVLSAIALLSSGAMSACGSSSEGSGGSSGAGGSSAGVSGSSGGAAAGAGGALGGASGAAAGAAGTSKGGSSGTAGGGSVDPGGPCTANCPKGHVQVCFDQCPLGACDDSGFYAATPCSTIYPSAIDDKTVYCKKGQTASYCLSALDTLLLDYMVSCANGTPAVTPCSGGCGVDSTGAAKCGQ
jgi:hypothetical protein